MIIDNQDFLAIKDVRTTDKGTVELLLKYPLQARRLRVGMEFQIPRSTSQAWFDYFLRRENPVLTVIASDHDSGVIELTEKKIWEN